MPSLGPITREADNDSILTSASSQGGGGTFDPEAGDTLYPRDDVRPRKSWGFSELPESSHFQHALAAGDQSVHNSQEALIPKASEPKPGPSVLVKPRPKDKKPPPETTPYMTTNAQTSVVTINTDVAPPPVADRVVQMVQEANGIGKREAFAKVIVATMLRGHLPTKKGIEKAFTRARP